jgi:hypothetical protein
MVILLINLIIGPRHDSDVYIQMDFEDIETNTFNREQP